MSAPITLTGRLGADPELRFANSGTATCNMRIVTDKRKKVGDEWVSEEVTWWGVMAFGSLAERCVEQLRKGSPGIVVGRVRGREWDDAKTGETRRILEVFAYSIGLDLARVRDDAPRPPALPQADDPWANQSAEAPF